VSHPHSILIVDQGNEIGAEMAQFAVQLTTGETVYINEADAYQFEGPLTTFFSTGSSRQVIDSWSTRVASYRTAAVLSIERFDMVLPMPAGDIVEDAALNEGTGLIAV